MKLGKQSRRIGSLAMVLAMLFFSYTADAHSLWLNFTDYMPAASDSGQIKTKLYIGWGHRFPVDSFVKSEDFESIILSMLGFEKYNGEWWFVMPYIFLLIMTPLMFRFLQRKKADFFTDFLVVFGIALFSLYGIPKLMSYDMLIDFKGTVWGILLCNVVYLLSIYLFGMIFAKYQVFSYYHQILPKGILSYPVLLFVAAAGFYMRYKIGSSYDFFLVGPMIYACVMLIKKIPGVIWVSKKAGRYITFVWLIHSFYVFQFGQKFIYSFGNPILIFIVLTVVSFASAAAVYWLFTGLSKGVKKIRCFHNRTV